jgi:hypothetical protein
MDNELGWEGPHDRSGDFADITIEDRGYVRLGADMGRERRGPGTHC